MESDEILVNFDVTFLFTNVHVGETVFIIHKRLRERRETRGQDLSLPGIDCRTTAGTN